MTQPTLSRTPDLMRRGESVVVERRCQGTYRAGEYIEGRCETFSVIANVQPITGYDLMQVPEGERHKRHFDVFTISRIKLDDILVGPDCNSTLGNGLRYKIVAAEDWGRYHRCKARLVDGQENSGN